MAKARTPIQTLALAINEDDPRAREALLEKVWHEDGTLLIDGELVAANREQLDAVIATWLLDPKAWVTALTEGPVDDTETAQWMVTGTDVRPATFDLNATLERGVIFALSAVRTDRRRPSQQHKYARLGEALLSNPVAAVGLLGGAFYLALRVPVGLFYGQLGVAPDEVGFGPQVLVPQSLTLVVSFLAAMTILLIVAAVAWPAIQLTLALHMLAEDDDRFIVRHAAPLVVHGSALLAVLIALAGLLVLGDDGQVQPWVTVAIITISVLASSIVVRVVAGAITRSSALVVRRRARMARRIRRQTTPREILEATAAAVAVYGLLLLLALPVWALVDAARVKEDRVAGGRLTPWRAQPVTLRWTKKDQPHVALTNDCKHLRLLGVGNGQLVLYDTRLDKLFRLPVVDASASVDRDCA